MSVELNQDITVEQLKEKFDNNEQFHFLDVREQFEHLQFNIGGNLIPINDLPNELHRFEEFKSKEIIVYCLSGKRSDTAKKILNQYGCTNVRNVLGGILDWMDKYGALK